jgi:hypothetical protein
VSYGDIKAAAKDLVALTLNGSPRWRMLVMVAILALSGSAVYGNQAYARKDELDQIKQRQLQAEIRDLTDDLLNARRNQCESQKGGAWANHIQRLKAAYHNLTGLEFMLPGCDDV